MCISNIHDTGKFLTAMADMETENEHHEPDMQTLEEVLKLDAACAAVADKFTADIQAEMKANEQMRDLWPEILMALSHSTPKFAVAVYERAKAVKL